MSAAAHGGLALVVSGPSGSGKTTLVKHLMLRFPQSHFSISSTTRAPRGEEVDGMDYRFMGREEFLDLRDRDRLLEWAEVHGEFYGTPRDEVVPHIQDGHHVFLDIDVQGGLSVREALAERAFLLYVLPPDMDTLSGRLRGRGTDSTEVVALRMKNALGELAVLPRYDAVVLNDDLTRAVDEAQTIIENRDRNLERWLSDGGREFMKSGFDLDLEI
jgi:guanylate kinase